MHQHVLRMIKVGLSPGEMVQLLPVKVYLPKSLALHAARKIKENPGFIRKIIKSRVKHHFLNKGYLGSDFKNAWSRKDDGAKLCSPYEIRQKRLKVVFRYF